MKKEVLIEKLKRFSGITKPKETLNDLVIKEAKNLKKFAYKYELEKLNFDTLNPSSSSNCIYGQMTGSCFNARANKLILKCATRVLSTQNSPNILENAKLNGEPTLIPEGENRLYTYISPIEKFIYLNTETNNQILIDFLQDKTKTLKFK